MLLNESELTIVVSEVVRKRIPDEYRLKYGPEGAAPHFIVDTIIAAERAKAAPHFDALPMLDGRELFMAGAEWGKAQAENGAQAKELKEKYTRLERDYMAIRRELTQVHERREVRRTELLELAKALAVAWTQNPGYEIDPDAKAESLERYGNAFKLRAAAILDAVDKGVAKPAEAGWGHEADFAQYCLKEGIYPMSTRYEVARQAFFAARGIDK